MTLLIENTLKVSLILVLGLGITALLRRRSAALRHWILATAVVCAAVAPAVRLVMPMWHVASFAPPAVPAASATVTTTASSQPTLQPSASAASSVGDVRNRPVDITRVFAAVWMAGVVVSLSVLIVGFARLLWIGVRSSRIVDGAWKATVDDTIREYGIDRRVTLLQSDHPTLLVTWGILRPKVILPVTAQLWDPDRIRVVLRHELAHIRRADWLAQILAEIVRCAYWFNPLAWMMCARIRQESEHACDDEVLNLGVDGPDYATHLLDLARLRYEHQYAWIPAQPIVRPSNLERRVTAMLSSTLDRRPVGELPAHRTFERGDRRRQPVAVCPDASRRCGRRNSHHRDDQFRRTLTVSTTRSAHFRSRTASTRHSSSSRASRARARGTC